ncbi:RNA pseudouridylate synthase [Candidatus Tiddalikarchaeum anstoanum]|nr:RNA pseudouridylate synthase [Candidatus Tiddalikarchaeum anstoanum]
MEPIIDSNLEILYEDDECIAVNKSGNCPVHEGGLYYNNTLTMILEKKYGFRLYPVYRLDRETSGIVVFAKKRENVKDVKIENKEYMAVVEGVINNALIIAEKIGEVRGEYVKWKMAVLTEGKSAETQIEPVRAMKNATIIKIFPKTGRQHQIRVHLQYIKHPVIGDKLYGESDKVFKDYLEGKDVDLPIKRQALHLYKIRLNNKDLTAPVPEDINELAAELSKII